MSETDGAAAVTWLTLAFSHVFLAVAMYREPSLHDVGETVPKPAVPPSKSTEPAVMNGGKPVSKETKPTT